MIIALLIIGYLASAILTYGITYGYFYGFAKEIGREEFAKKSDAQNKIFALFFSLFSPLWTIVAYFCSDFAKHGLKFR